MGLALHSKMAVVLIGFCVMVSLAPGQETQQPRFSQTVSVSSLQIPSKAWKHFEKALNAADHNRPDESQQELTKALDIAPNIAKAFILRATQEIHQQHYDAAIADATSAAKIEPGVMWAAVILAGAYNSLHRYKDALLVLDNLRGAEADTWQAKYERSRAEIGSGDVEAALYWSALAVGATPPDVPDISLLRADAFLLAHRWKEAQSELKLYLESKNSQTHRQEVLRLLEVVRTRIEQATSREVASR